MEMQHWQNQINTRGRNVVLVFLLYWFTLVFWQNINPGSTGTTEDTFIKIALLFSLILVFISKAKFRRKGAVLLFSRNNSEFTFDPQLFFPSFANFNLCISRI